MKSTKTFLTVVAVVVTFFLVAFLVRQMARMTRPAPVGAERAATRAADNAQIRAEGISKAGEWGYVDAQKGIVRLPVEAAVKATVQGYQNPAAFKKDLVARSTKASAPAPAAKNEYE